MLGWQEIALHVTGKMLIRSESEIKAYCGNCHCNLQLNINRALKNTHILNEILQTPQQNLSLVNRVKHKQIESFRICGDHGAYAGRILHF